jgi:hypothetical protein
LPLFENDPDFANRIRKYLRRPLRFSRALAPKTSES